jgi:hypothetical protein
MPKVAKSNPTEKSFLFISEISLIQKDTLKMTLSPTLDLISAVRAERHTQFKTRP